MAVICQAAADSPLEKFNRVGALLVEIDGNELKGIGRQAGRQLLV